MDSADENKSEEASILEEIAELEQQVVGMRTRSRMLRAMSDSVRASPSPRAHPSPAVQRPYLSPGLSGAGPRFPSPASRHVTIPENQQPSSVPSATGPPQSDVAALLSFLVMERKEREAKEEKEKKEREAKEEREKKDREAKEEREKAERRAERREREANEKQRREQEEKWRKEERERLDQLEKARLREVKDLLGPNMSNSGFRMSPLTDTDDIDAYLCQFEHIAALQK